MGKSTAQKGSKGFEAAYGAMYEGRWPALREALLAPARQVARINRFAGAEHLALRFDPRLRQRFAGVEWIPVPEHAPLLPQTDAAGLSDCYLMDLASVFAALALGARPGERVLDMCAAPGGKTLILAEAMQGQGELIANEVSDNRRSRLLRVLREYLPEKYFQQVRVTGHDASRWCLYEKDAYDRVLLDAPCSGERHLLENQTELRSWSEARSKNLAVRQYGLLASAIQAVKPGGRVVYSTCALARRENDDIIARLLKRRPGEARVLSGASTTATSPGAVEEAYPPPLGEPTEYGWAILPDTSGYGPIYFSVLQRC